MPAWAFSALALLRAGAVPLRLTPARYPADRPLPRFDGLVLGGGADVDPALYGGRHERPTLATSDSPGGRTGALLAGAVYYARRLFALSHGGIDTARDELETRALADAVERCCPVLGICRGAQFLNIHFGGDLHTDLAGFYGEVGNIATVKARKPVAVRPGSRLHDVLGTGHLRVNSLHNQAIDRLGRDITIAARDRASVVQSIEHPRYPYLIGVQWHPEYLPQSRRHQRLFRALVRHAREHPGAPGG